MNKENKNRKRVVHDPPAAATPPGSPWLTSKDVCEILGISDETLMRYRQKGRLKFSRLSYNLLRYHRDDVDEFIRRTPSFPNRSWCGRTIRSERSE
jgi:excisionase family DNA binding protein